MKKFMFIAVAVLCTIFQKSQAQSCPDMEIKNSSSCDVYVMFEGDDGVSCTGFSTVFYYVPAGTALVFNNACADMTWSPSCPFPFHWAQAAVFDATMSCYVKVGPAGSCVTGVPSSAVLPCSCGSTVKWAINFGTCYEIQIF